MKFFHKDHYVMMAVLFLLSGFFAFPARAAGADPAVLMFEISGNTHVPAEKVLGVISNSRIGAPVDSNLVQQDIQAIYNLGYFSDVRATVEKMFNGVKLIFIVVENPLFQEVRITGLTNVNPRELTPFFSQKPGEVFCAALFQEDLGKALKHCQEKKGLFIRPAGQSPPAVSAAGIIRLDLTELKYGKTKLLGLQKTKEQVVHRELAFREGDLINIIELQTALLRLMRLRLFENIEPKFETGGAPDTLDLVLEIKETRTGNYSFGGVYDEQTHQLGADIGYSESNLMGLGQSLNLAVDLGQSFNNVSMSFNDPWLDEHHTSLGFSIWNNNTYMYSTMKSWRPSDSNLYYLHFVKTGFSLSLGRPVTKDITASLALTIEKNDLKSYLSYNSATNAYDIQGGPPTNGAPLEFWDNALQLSVMNNQLQYADSNFVKGGFLLQGAVRISGKYLGSYFDYQKITGDWVGFHALSPNLVLGNRVELACQNGPVPDYNRLYLGGMMRLRGYSNEMYYNPSLIGDYYWLNNTELRYRLPVNKNIEFVLFADAGQMFTAAVPTFKYNYGVGIRLNIPILGLLRFDQAWNGDNGSQFFFGVNEIF